MRSAAATDARLAQHVGQRPADVGAAFGNRELRLVAAPGLGKSCRLAVNDAEFVEGNRVLGIDLEYLQQLFFRGFVQPRWAELRGAFWEAKWEVMVPVLASISRCTLRESTGCRARS